MKAFRTLLLVLVVVHGVPVFCDSFSLPIDPFGQIRSARVLPTLPTPSVPQGAMADQDAGPTKTFFFAPIFQSGESSRAFGLVGGFGDAKARVPYEVSVSYFSIDPDGGDRLDRVGVDGKINRKMEKVTVAALGSFAIIPDIATSLSVGVSADIELTKRLSGTGTIAFARSDPETGDTVDDAQPGVGIAYGFSGGWAVGADYTLENDIDGDDSLSGSVIYANERAGMFKVTVARDETLTFVYARSFGGQ